MTPELSSKQHTVTRSKRLMLISMLLVVSSVLALLFVPSKMAATIGLVYQALVAVGAFVSAASAYGIWKNRKWGVYSYIGYALLAQPIMLSKGIWFIGALVIPGLIIAILLSKLNSMD